MEKVLEVSEKTGLGFLSVTGDCVNISLDSKFPILENPYPGYDVNKAIIHAEGVFQYFMNFIETISPIGI